MKRKRGPAQAAVWERRSSESDITATGRWLPRPVTGNFFQSSMQMGQGVPNGPANHSALGGGRLFYSRNGWALP